jgi:uncharacterized protein YcfJ
MKMTVMTSIALLLTAMHAHAFEAVATVVGVVPINENVNIPTQQCWAEYPQQVQPAPQQHDYLGAIVGGVAGGLLGSQIGKGNGRVAGAAAGAGLGAIVGDRLDNRDSNRINAAPAPVQRCQQVDHFETRTTGYQVTYEYDGQRFVTRLPYNPGTQLRVNVSVAPQ